MAVGYNPRAITDGLVLSLDAGNPKNYNAGISTNWTDKVGGNNGTLFGGTHHNDGPFVGAGYVEFANSDNDGFNVSNSTGWFDPNNTSQWTLEGWILNPSSTSAFSVYSGTWGSIGNFGCSIGGGVAFQSGNGAWAWVTNSTIVADTGSPTGWNHFAFTKNASTYEVFLNGSRIYTGTPTFGTGGTGGSIHLQSYFSNTLYYQNAEGLSNVRYVTGSVLYSGTSYTVPTEPLTAIPGTQLLIYQGNTFTDASPNNLTLTVQNSPTANLGSPASAFEFDGTDDYVAITNTANLRLGNEDFTIESWVQFGSGLSGSESIFGVWDNTNNQRSYLFYYDSSGDDLYFSASSDGTGSGITNVIANNVGFTANRWYHLVASRISGTTTIYIDGVSSASGTQNFSFYNNTTDTFAIGAANVDHSITNQLKGKISNVKVHKGKGLTAAEVTQNYNATKGRYA